MAMQRLVRQFARDVSGATAIEYAMIAAGISVVIVAVVAQIGTSLSGMFTKVQSAFH